MGGEWFGANFNSTGPNAVTLAANSFGTITGVADNTWHGLQAVSNSTNGVINVNGTDNAVGTGTFDPISSLVVGGFGAASQILAGSIAEIGATNTAFTTGQSVAMNTSQQAFWGY